MCVPFPIPFEARYLLGFRATAMSRFECRVKRPIGG